MNVRRYQKWAKSGLAIMLAGAMMVGNSGIRWRDDCTGSRNRKQ